MATHERGRRTGGTSTASPSGAPGESDPAHDRVLVAQCVAGDQSAFERLLARHLGAVVVTARRILDDEAEAEDVAQEAMLRLWSLAATLEVPDHGIRAWLKRVAQNLALDRVRQRRRVDVTDTPPEIAVAPTQSRRLDEAGSAARVQAAMAGLPERQRVALVLFHFEGLAQAEVARSMQVSEEAVESLLARARRTLKVALRDDWHLLLSDDERT